jgi:mRNA interferase RelE/StbE
VTPYELIYHPDVKRKDISRIPGNIRDRIRDAIERRLGTEPLKYGQPLRRALKGYRKLRVGDFRVLYRIEQHCVVILLIGHRSDVYIRAHERIQQ